MISFKDYIVESDNFIAEAYTKEMTDVFSQEELKNAGRVMNYWNISAQGSTFKEMDANLAMKNSKSLDGKAALIKTKKDSNFNGDSYLVIFKYDTISVRNITKRYGSDKEPSRKAIVSAAEKIFYTDIPEGSLDKRVERMNRKPKEEKPLKDRLAAFKTQNRTGYAFIDSKSAKEDFEKIKEKVKVYMNKFIDDFTYEGGVSQRKKNAAQIFEILSQLAIYSTSLDKNPDDFNLGIYKNAVESFKKIGIL